MCEWQTLVQVCKRWQETIYASPRYLHLFLYFSNGDFIAETLDRWSQLPLAISYSIADECCGGNHGLYDLLAQRDRIRRIRLFTTRLETDCIAETMEQQYPHLTHLDLIAALTLGPWNLPYIFLGRFLGGSAPSLQHLCVDNFNYEGLLSLLSSAPNLVSLQIKNIHPTCYVSPEEMVRALARLTKLRDLCIEFSRRAIYEFRKAKDSQRPHSPFLVRVIFPALTKFKIGHNEYSNDLMALIDAPRLEDLSVKYTQRERHDAEEVINAGNLSQFISRTPTFKQFRRVELTVGRHITRVNFDLPCGKFQQARLSLAVSGNRGNWLTPFTDPARDMMHVLGQLTIMLSDVQHLSIKGMGSEDKERQLETHGLRNVDLAGVNWLPLFRSLPAVEVVHVAWTLAKYISRAFRDLPEHLVAAMLPALQVLKLDVQDWRHKGKLMAYTERFLSLRQRSGHPVVIVNSQDQFVESLSPYQLELSGSTPVPLVTPIDARF